MKPSNIRTKPNCHKPIKIIITPPKDWDRMVVKNPFGTENMYLSKWNSVWGTCTHNLQIISTPSRQLLPESLHELFYHYDNQELNQDLITISDLLFNLCFPPCILTLYLVNKILLLQENQQNSLILASAIRNKYIVIRKHSFPCKIIGNNQDIDQILQLTEIYYLSC